MKRNLQNLANNEYDLLIIGGGIYGAAVTWDAVLRGLKVALIEQKDFASGTSSNSLKIIHGGLRYLQHADFIRMRESIKERRVMMQIAPHLVHPMPCVMPTYGHAIKGPEVMRIALLMNDIISFDRNKLQDKQKHIPMGRILSKDELLEISPYVDKNNLTGGAMWHDAQMTNSERLALSFVKSASQRGAKVANYVEAEKFLISNGRVTGAQVKDTLSGDTFDVRAKMTISTAGPWINNLFGSLNGRLGNTKVEFSTALNLVINRKLGKDIAFGAPSRFEFKDKDALINRGSRLLFIVPWRDRSIVGTAHKPYRGDAQDFKPTDKDIQEFLDEVNKALAGANISRDEVSFFYGGLLPMSGYNEQSGDVTIEKHFRIYDHEAQHNLPGLLSLLSVKYTTARGVAQNAVDAVFSKLGKGKVKSTSDLTRLVGGDIDDITAFKQHEKQNLSAYWDGSCIEHLVTSYGTEYKNVIEPGNETPELLQHVSSTSPILKAELVYGIREEMAEKLADVVMRRTEMGTAEQPDAETLLNSAKIMAAEKGWDKARIEKEIKEVEEIYQPK